MYMGLHVKYPLFLSDFNDLEFCRDFRKCSNTKFHEIPSTGNPVDPCGRVEKQTKTDMTKLIVAFRNFANAPENYKFHNQGKSWKSIKILDQIWYKRERSTVNLYYKRVMWKGLPPWQRSVNLWRVRKLCKRTGLNKYYTILVINNGYSSKHQAPTGLIIDMRCVLCDVGNKFF
jgi:hypothetical protein